MPRGEMSRVSVSQEGGILNRLVKVLVVGTVLSVALVSVVGASGSSSKSSAAIPAFTAAQLSAPAGANWIPENANPIVYNGVMYVQDAWTRITALDAGSGKTLWQFDPQIGLNVAGNGNN